MYAGKGAVKSYLHHGLCCTCEWLPEARGRSNNRSYRLGIDMSPSSNPIASDIFGRVGKQMASESVRKQEGFYAEAAAAHIDFHGVPVLPGVIIRPVAFHVLARIAAIHINSIYLAEEILIIIPVVSHLNALSFIFFSLCCEGLLCASLNLWPYHTPIKVH